MTYAELVSGISASGLGFRPQGWDLGLKARFWASRLGFWPHGQDFGLEAREEMDRWTERREGGEGEISAFLGSGPKGDKVQ